MSEKTQKWIGFVPVIHQGRDWRFVRVRQAVSSWVTNLLAVDFGIHVFSNGSYSSLIASKAAAFGEAGSVAVAFSPHCCCGHVNSWVLLYLSTSVCVGEHKMPNQVGKNNGSKTGSTEFCSSVFQIGPCLIITLSLCKCVLWNNATISEGCHEKQTAGDQFLQW